MSDDDRPDTPPAPKPRLKRLRFLAILLAVLVLGLISFVFGMFVAVASDLPSLTRFSQIENAKSSVLLDDLGHPLGVVSQQNRVIVTPGQIPEIVKEAVISVEDKRFQTNSGVDIRGIARAFVQDVEHRGNIQGASTIEQQFIKNALQAQSHRTIFEKLREAALAYQLSHKWSKEKIITAYLNTIYFGNGAYGIESAAQTYFGADVNHLGCGTPSHELCVKQLQPWEAALLAGIIQSPTAYDPVNHPEAAKARRNVVLRQMLEQGYLTRAVYEESIRQALPAPHEVQAPQEQTVEGIDAGYFTSWVQQQVIERYGAPRAFDGGLRIKTTLDIELQHAAEQAVNAYLAYPGGPTASLVAIENSTGEVRAMVGGRNYNETPFNLATEGERQPGSSFKAFDLAAALEHGISPYSEWTSKEKEFIVPNTHGQERFVVHNDEGNYTGENTLTGATAFSDNSIYAEVGLEVGTKKIARLAHRMGITTPLSTNPAMTIGGLTVGVTPLDMAHAYETIAHDGRRVTGTLAEDDAPVGIQEVEAGGRPLPDGAAPRQESRAEQTGASSGSRPDGDLDARNGHPVRHRQGGGDRSVRGRQDGNHLQLRRRLVRGLGLQVHGRGVGRLPQQADPHDQRFRRRPGARRNVPGADLARLHDLGAADRQEPRRTGGRCRGAQGRDGRNRRQHVNDQCAGGIRAPSPSSGATWSGHAFDRHGQGEREALHARPRGRRKRRRRSQRDP